MVYFLRLQIFVYLRTKFQVSSIILTNFRQGEILLPSAKRTVNTLVGKSYIPVLLNVQKISV